MIASWLPIARRSLAFPLALLVLMPASGHAAGAVIERLPTTVVPLHYDLSLIPDAEHLTFSGDVQIDVQVAAAVSAVVLNAKGLVFDAATLDDGAKATVTLDGKLERASLGFAGGVSPGTHVLHIRYHGAIAHSTLGFFAMDYQSAAGKRRTLATNFEPASERLLMPSWDEPGFKATFRVTVDAPADRMAVSNMPIESETPLPNGLKRVRFLPTPKMSTYLLFLAVGDFERITDTIDGVQVGVVVASGDTGRGRYALEQATRLMHYYNDYFGVHYPLPKLDLIAAPGQIEGGSMENWGAIFYSQKHILFDPKNSTDDDRRLVFLVVAHEMSHQWFGDLVTMSWWDNLWLNEGFARWMQTKAADDLNPEWETGLRASSIVEQGMRADAKPSTHPVEQPVASAAEAELAFDEITYDKGASVIGMLESYVGADRFREGVRAYMHEHAFGNTVSADLWRALQAAAGKDVLGIADDFTRRAGLPLVSVEAAQPESAGEGGPGRVQLTQSRFIEGHRSGIAASASPAWRLPLAVKSLTGDTVATTVLDVESAAVAFDGPAPAVVNTGHKGYTRVRYTPAMFTALAAHLATLSPADQVGALQDAWALGQSEYAPITNVVQLLDALPTEANPIVWLRAVRILEAIDHLYDGLPTQAAFREWARARLAPVGARVGWEAAPGQAQNASELRMPLLIALARFGDRAVSEEGAKRYAATVSDPTSESPEARRAAREIVARQADAVVFDRMVAQLRSTRDPLEKQDMFEALADVADPALAARLLDMIIGPDAPAGSMPDLLLSVAEAHPDLAWKFGVAHVDVPGFPMDRSTRMEVMPLLCAPSADLRRVPELKAYAAKHLPAAAARPVEAAVAQIKLNARVRAVQLARIDAWLKTSSTGRLSAHVGG